MGDNMETVIELKRKVAQLETQLDYMQTEFSRLNDLLVQFGFDEGIFTLAESLEEAVEIDEYVRIRERKKKEEG
jgi:hypothetical protein